MTFPQTLRAMVTGLVLVAALPLGAAWADLQETFSVHDETSTKTVDHSAYGAVLTRYLSEGPNGVMLFDYAAVSLADKAALKDYIAMLEATDVAALNRDEQFAYWANLYNAVTLDVVLEAYPVDSIRDIRPSFFSFGPWGKERVTVAGKALSLDDIEHKIMRKVWDDPRVHYAVNCASIGCPNLYPEPFTGATLDAALERNAAAYINHPRGARIDNGRLFVSSIYDWFEEDFGGSERGVIAHLKRYAEGDLKAALESRDSIDAYEYDWSLNAPAK